MRTNDDIWEVEQDRWGVDRVPWEEEEGESVPDADESTEAPEDPRY